ncbi:hypothetical protein GF336_04400 [Candidatus Woesearchaeota archaeon]|nr:hypothetical protein [Candidatus Woesearchaeota archaeon]
MWGITTYRCACSSTSGCYTATTYYDDCSSEFPETSPPDAETCQIAYNMYDEICSWFDTIFDTNADGDFTEGLSTQSCGGSGNFLGQGGPAVPEFSTVGVILASIIAIVGIVFVIKKRK